MSLPRNPPPLGGGCLNQDNTFKLIDLNSFKNHIFKLGRDKNYTKNALNQNNNIKLINLESKKLSYISFSDLFSSSLYIQGNARTGKTTLFLNGIKSKLINNENVVFFHNSHSTELLLKSLCEQYNYELSSSINNLSLHKQLISIKISDLDNSNTLDFLIDFYSDLNKTNLNLFIDEVYSITNSSSLKKLVYISNSVNLKIFIISNHLSDFIFDNIPQHIFFNITDISKKEKIINFLNLTTNTIYFDLDSTNLKSNATKLNHVNVNLNKNEFLFKSKSDTHLSLILN